MSSHNYQSALKKITEVAPKSVREREILRISASLVVGADANGVRQEILKWVQRRCGGILPKEAWDGEAFDFFSGGRNSSVAKLETEDANIWSVRADDPDKTVPGRIWTTEVVVGGAKSDDLARLSVRLLVSSLEPELNIEPHVPGFMQQIVEKFSLLSGVYDLTDSVRVIESEHDVFSLIEMLLDQNRKLPVFVLTVPDDSSNPSVPLIDPSALARAILGIGYVVVLPAKYTWALSDALGRERSVFGGAIRVYLPGFSTDAAPFNHRLFLASHLSTANGKAQCLRWIKELSAKESIRREKLGSDVLSFASIKRANLELQQRALETSGASDAEKLKAAVERIQALENQLESEKSAFVHFSDEYESMNERAQLAENQLRAMIFRTQQLSKFVKENGHDVDKEISVPQRWNAFENWCDTTLAGRVVLSPLARRNIKAPEFEDVGLVARCLLWLANECRDKRISGGEGSLREAIVEGAIRNAHCGGDEFEYDWCGQRYTTDWHIKCGGNTRDPKRCLRIYYFWDEDTQQIVIVDMPHHRRTGAT